MPKGMGYGKARSKFVPKFKRDKKTGDLRQTTRSIKKEIKSWRNPDYKKKKG